MKRLLILWMLLAAPFSFGAANWRTQSAATTFQIGPFVKIADGSYEDAATITGISLSFIKYSATMVSTVTTVSAAVSGSNNDCVFVAKGTYSCEASAANTDTLGTLEIRATYTGTYGSRTSLEIVHANSMAILQAGQITTGQGVWDVLTSAASVTSGGMGERIVNGLDVPVSSLIAYSTRMAGTTITVGGTQLTGTISAGSPDNDAYKGAIAIIIDQATPTQQCATTISSYVGSSKTYTLATACPFTLANGDLIRIFAGDSNVTAWGGVPIATPDSPGYPKVTIKDGTGQGELSITAGQMDGLATPAQISAALMSTTYEGTETFKDFLRFGAAMLFNNYTSGSGAFQFKDKTGAKTRIGYNTTATSRTTTTRDGTD